MYWRAKENDHESFIKRLKEYDVIKKDLTYDAMMMVDRAFYCPNGNPYNDSPQSIGYSVTISAPHMHACALDLVNPILVEKKRKVNVLDVGSGSGYLVACFAHIVCNHGGLVYGVEIIPQLVDRSQKSLKKDPACAKWLDEKKIVIKEGDAWEGLKGSIKFDIIHVGAAAATIPESLVNLMNEGGRMIIPVGDYSQNLLQVDKHKGGKVTQKKIFGVRYVPLVNPKKRK